MSAQRVWMERAKQWRRLHEELADARAAIRWLRDGDEPIDVVAVSEAIRKAREAGR